MKNLKREEAQVLWNQYWDEMREEWFKLEVLQDYTGEDDGSSLRRWYRGDRPGSIEQLKLVDPDPEFTARCQKKMDQGVKLLRIRIIEEPLSPYTAWELEFYKLISQPLRGEQVFVIKKADIKDLDLPNGDMMIFDSSRVTVNSYDQNGRVVSTNFYDQADNISKFIGLKIELQKRVKAV